MCSSLKMVLSGIILSGGVNNSGVAAELDDVSNPTSNVHSKSIKIR